MTERFALVTGGGSGIGRASALALLADGWSVAVAGRRRAPLEETLELAGEDGRRGLAIAADIGVPERVEALFAAIESRFGRLDLLFNNAGDNVASMPLEEVSYADWTRVVQTNVTGTFLCSQHAYRLMKSQTPRGGRIINNGAPSAHVPRPDAVTFTATKHAITGLTRAIALEGRRHDIACGQIDIGNVATTPDQPPHAAMQGDGSRKVEPIMQLEQVTDTLLTMANLPLHANILFVTVMPTKMPLVGRG